MRNRHEFTPVYTEEYHLRNKSEQIIDDLLDRTREGISDTNKQLPNQRVKDQTYPAGLAVYTLEDFKYDDVTARGLREVNAIWNKTRPVPKTGHQYYHSRDTEPSNSQIGLLHSIEWPTDNDGSRPISNETLSEEQNMAHESIIREVGKAAMVAAGGEARPIIAVIDANVLTESPENAQAMTDFFRSRAADLRKLDVDGTLWARKMILIKNPPFAESTREARNRLLDLFRDTIKEDEWLAADVFPAGVSRDEAYPAEAIVDDSPIIAPPLVLERDTVVRVGKTRYDINQETLR